LRQASGFWEGEEPNSGTTPPNALNFSLRLTFYSPVMEEKISCVQENTIKRVCYLEIELASVSFEPRSLQARSHFDAAAKNVVIHA
jgi:hypothetical protein